MGTSRLAIVVFLASCYSPSFGDCEVTCASGHCPSGYTCEAGVCRVPGFTGPCGSVMADGSLGDMPMNPTDGMNADTMCSYACWAPSPTASPRGFSACEVTSNNCNTNMAWLNPIDFCTCSVGEPELYIQRMGSAANIAIVGPTRPAGSTYAMAIDNGVCYGTARVCPAIAVTGCTQSSEVDGWLQVPVASGLHTYRFFNDDGASGCSGNPLHTFVVNL